MHDMGHIFCSAFFSVDVLMRLSCAMAWRGSFWAVVPRPQKWHQQRQTGEGCISLPSPKSVPLLWHFSITFLSPRHATGSVRAGGGCRHGAPDATATAIHAAGLGMWVIHMGGWWLVDSLMDLVGELGKVKRKKVEGKFGKCKSHETNFAWQTWQTCFIGPSIHPDAPGIRSRSFGAGRQPGKCRLHIHDRKV